MKTGIYCGVFDPVHVGHVSFAEYVLELGLVDRLVIVPTSVPPHKKPPVTSIEHRFQMVLLAFGQESPFYIFSGYESGDFPSYTCDTVAHLRKLYSGDDLFFIIGLDSMLQLKKWKNYGEIIKNVKFIVSGRDGSRFSQLSKVFGDEFVDEKMVVLDRFKPLKVSSTEVRELLRQNREYGLSFLMPSVAEYVVENRLYV